MIAQAQERPSCNQDYLMGTEDWNIQGDFRCFGPLNYRRFELNNFKNWSCNAGIESLMINWDGEVHRATCRVGGSLGNIYNDDYTKPSEPIICTRDWCTCAADRRRTAQPPRRPRRRGFPRRPAAGHRDPWAAAGS